MIEQPCYGFHSSVIPFEANEVVDTAGQFWIRAGVRSWRRWPGNLDPDRRMHESWLLEQGPVRCPVVERTLGDRDAKLEAQLPSSADEGPWVWLPGSVGDGEPVAYEDAMMLMRAGWLAWGPKQRREALVLLREPKERELAATS